MNTVIAEGLETQSDRQDWLNDLVTAAATAPRNSLAFYTPAKIATHILNTGSIDFPRKREFDVSGGLTGWFANRARRMLRHRAEDMGLAKVLAVGPGPGR